MTLNEAEKALGLVAGQLMNGQEVSLEGEKIPVRRVGRGRLRMVQFRLNGRVFEAIESLKPEDLMLRVTIRGEPHTVLQAINRQVAHYAYHTGQIVFLAKHIRSGKWKTLSIPRGKSEEFKTVAPKPRKS